MAKVRGRKLHKCDCCGKMRADVKSVGRDSNGDPDAPCACFICRKEFAKGRVWNDKAKGYVPAGVEDADIELREGRFA